MPTIIDFAERLQSDASFSLEGHKLGEVTNSVILVDFPQDGMGPRLHCHPYTEMFILLEGEARFTAGDEEALVRAGQIAIAPPNTPHKFASFGPGPLKLVAIQSSPKFQTESLEGE